MVATKQDCQNKVSSIFMHRDKEFISNSLGSFNLKSKRALANEFFKIVVAFEKNKSTNNFSYLSDFQMSVFTTFETELRSLMNCSEQTIMLSKYNI